MHPRRLLTFILGFWLACFISVAAFTSMSYRAVDRVLMKPPQELERWVKSVRYDQLRLALSHFAGEINRSLIEIWGYVDLAIVLVLIIALVFYRRTKPVMMIAGAIFLLGLISTFLLSPQLIGQGRLADFAPIGIQTEVRQAYEQMQSLYWGLAIVRILLGVGLLGMMLIQTVRAGGRSPVFSRKRRSSRSSRSGEVEQVGAATTTAADDED